MAASLRRAGVRLVVYNRSPGPRLALAGLGALAVDTPEALFDACDAVILMLADDAAVEAVLGRGRAAFEHRVQGRLIINMGTHAPDWSRRLAAEIEAAGGAFVEAPVSGSRRAAAEAQLVAMLAGREPQIARARRLIAPMCRQILVAGAAPRALALKLAVNLYLLTTVTALAEAAGLAQRLGVDPGAFQAVIAGGQLGSAVAVGKLAKMATADYAPEAAIADVCKNARLIAAAASQAGAPFPMLEESRRRFELVLAQGGGERDMAAVVETFRVGPA